MRTTRRRKTLYPVISEAVLLQNGPPEVFSNLVASLFPRIVSKKAVSLPAMRRIHLTNLRDDAEVVRRERSGREKYIQKCR